MRFNIVNNIFTKGVKQILVCLTIKLKNTNKNLNISCLSTYYKCSWGKYNTVGENNFLFNLKLGDFSYITRNVTINNTTIGKFCSIGQDVIIGPGKHPSSKFVSTHPIFYSSKKNLSVVFTKNKYYNENENIEIGNDVWIGAKAIILDGVNIGHGAIIAAGSLVNKDVKPYSIVGGIPAKHIKFRFSLNEIEYLLKQKWWDNDIETLKKNFKEYHDIENFTKEIKN